ncbi:hypothetical protein QOT17_021142 [Balamuthia mandrillaris]
MADTKLCLCLLSLWIFYITTPSLSCDIFVDVRIGNDVNDGASPSSPLLTVHEASKRVVTGDTKHNRICLSAGVYQQPQFLFKPFNSSDSRKEIIVEGPARCQPFPSAVADESCAFLQSLEATVTAHPCHLALKSLWISQLNANQKHPVGFFYSNKGYGVYQAESMDELRQDVAVGLECSGYKDPEEYQLVWIQNDEHFVEEEEAEANPPSV